VELTARDRLIVALDVSSDIDADNIIASVGSSVSAFKVGKQLFTAMGPVMVRRLIDSGYKVFLDLKYHDIPNTVAAAVAEAAKLGVAMLTVHASGGTKMLKAAQDAAASSATPPLILAVTVLTSLGDQDLAEIGVAARALDQVLRLAVLARNAGVGGVVASAQEAQAIRRALGPQFAIVTPGVRPAGAEAGDQARVLTPAEAIRAGATHIVVGRPITEAKDPGTAARAIIDEIEKASS
jgi:orotidine-5'-phosphate decarboxylase